MQSENITAELASVEQQALRLIESGKASIDALPDDLNIAIFSSGGFTHFTIDEEFGGWDKAHATHFADGALFDQIYKP